MATLLLIVWVLTLLGLVVLAAMRPPQGRLSRYELQRRAEQAGDHQAQAELRRYQYQAVVLGISRALQLLLVVLGFYCVITLLGIGWGGLLTLGVIVLHPVLARWLPFVHLGQRLYRYLEPRVEGQAHRLTWLYALIRLESHYAPQTQLGSRHELAHLIDQAGTHMSTEERELLLHSLAFEERTVADVMLPAERITTVDRRELLGPLVLDDLHKTGHAFFPVVDGDLSRIVGVLSIDGFLSLDDKRSITAEKAMSSHIVYVRDTASLRAAIKLFMQSHQHLLIVEDAEGAAVGALTLYDCLRVLFGSSR